MCKKSSAAAILFWLIIWQFVSISVGHGFLLPPPLDVLRALARIAAEGGFYVTLIASVGRILLGFFIGMSAAITAAALSGASMTVRRLLTPLVFAVKTVPVASFIILMLIWVSSGQLPTAISAMMVFPVIYTNVLAGITGCSPGLLEMAKVFDISRLNKLLCIYIPEVMPHFRSGASLALGLAWKAGVAAEVIGLPKYSIGENLYEAKITLSTDELLAWTLVIIALSVLFEKVFMKILDKAARFFEKKLGNAVFASARAENPMPEPAIDMRDISKSYGDRQVLKGVSLKINSGEHIVIVGESGCGKTTLLRVIMGLEASDFQLKGSVAAVFQEDRLVESLSAAANIRLAMHGGAQPEETVKTLLDSVGLAAEHDTPVRHLSGGMKRRISILRAIGRNAHILIFDEPLRGMDEKTKEKTGRLIQKHIQGKAVIYVTHDVSEARYLQNPAVYTIERGELTPL